MDNNGVDKDKKVFKKFKFPFVVFFTTSVFIFFLYPKQLAANKLILVPYLVLSLVFIVYYFWYRSRLK